MLAADHLNGISIFVAAADAGGFTQAAQRLGLSKSGVAKAVLRVEERLGARLFNRTTRRFALTAEGQAFYETCSRVLADLERAETSLAADQLQPRGRLRVDLPVVFGRRWALPVVLDVAARHPDLSIEISFTNRRTDLVEESVDLAVRIGDLEDTHALIARKLGVQRSVLCASPAYVERRGRPAVLADLSAHSCIAHPRGGQSMPWWFTDADGRLIEQHVSGRLSFNDAEAICEATLAGHGIALLSTCVNAGLIPGQRGGVRAGQ